MNQEHEALYVMEDKFFLTDAGTKKIIAAAQQRIDALESALRGIRNDTHETAIYKIADMTLNGPNNSGPCKHVAPSEPRWFAPCPKCGYCSPDISKGRNK